MRPALQISSRFVAVSAATALWCTMQVGWAAPAPSSEAVTGAEFVKNLTAIIATEYLYKMPSDTLFNGAVQGLNDALKAKKLPAMKLAKVKPRSDITAAGNAFAEDFYQVAAKYPKLLQDEYLQVAAVRGMLKTLKDPYTIYMDEKEFGALREAMNGGNFGGLGIYIELDKDNQNALTVIEPMEDTPAMRGGIRARDVIVQIDETSTRKTTLPEAMKLLRGEVGSKVLLQISRKGTPEPFWVELTRDRIRVSSVQHKMVENEGTKLGYVKLKVFGENTNQEMEEALRDLERQGAQGFVFDLRNNGGGYINAAVDVCSKFLPTGSRVVSVQERGEDEVAYFSHPNLHSPWPLVLLVNEFSASASEITAGAMKDLKRAKLVGNKTFGKGSVQKIFPVGSGAMKVTTAHYHTPRGADINKLGIEPDVKVVMPIQKLNTDEDEQFKVALKTATDEVKALPVANQPDPNWVASVEDEVRILNEQKAQGFSVTRRSLIREQDRLFEDVTLEKSGAAPRTLRLDLSRYLQR